MTIKEYLQDKKPAADWVAQIKKDNLRAFESQILTCADLMGLIIVNQNANFQNCIKL